MLNDTSILDQLTPEDAAIMRADILRETTEKARILAEHAERVRERVFKSRLPSIKMFSKLGTPIVFVNHMHITNLPEVISYLEAEIKISTKDVYIDNEEIFFDADKYDPQKQMYNKARAELELEYAARLAAATDPNRNMGDSTAQKLTPGSTTSIAPTAAGAGPSAGLVNRLGTIKIPGK